VSFPTFEPSVLSWLQLPFARFDGAKDDKLPKLLHETTKKDKGKEFAFKGFKSPFLIDAKDMKVNPLFVIFI